MTAAARVRHRRGARVRRTSTTSGASATRSAPSWARSCSRQVSARLRSAVRPGRPRRPPGRQGFLVLLRDLPIDARLHAEAVGQRITDAMHAPFALGAAELLVEVSVGISIFPDDAETPESLRKHADAAMYEARAAGGGVHVYGAGTADPLERLELAARLRRAIERGELELHHQPILRLADEAVMGVESLVRWRDPARGGGLVPPGEFIPVAERTGVIDPLGRLGPARGLPPGARLGRGRAQAERRLQRLAAPAAPARRRAALRRGRARPRDRARPLRARDHRVGLVAGGLAPAAGARRAARRRLRAGDRRLRRRLLLAVAAARVARPDHQGRPRVPVRRAGGPAGRPRSTPRSCAWPTPAAATSSPRASRPPSTRPSWPPAAAASPRASTSAARSRVRRSPPSSSGRSRPIAVADAPANVNSAG